MKEVRGAEAESLDIVTRSLGEEHSGYFKKLYQESLIFYSIYLS